MLIGRRRSRVWVKSSRLYGMITNQTSRTKLGFVVEGQISYIEDESYFLKAVLQVWSVDNVISGRSFRAEHGSTTFRYTPFQNGSPQTNWATSRPMKAAP